MQNDYSKKLSAERLKQCYEIAPLRIRQYLEAEIEYVLGNIDSPNHVLELGCGYGRVLKRLIGKAGRIVGIDSCGESLQYAKKYLPASAAYELDEMNAISLQFESHQFDVVFCIQNGISAFKVDQRELIEEAVRVTRPGGKVLFSSYSEKIWKDRLEWFQQQSAAKLLGELDYEASGNGIIVCQDGFRATTISAEDFQNLTSGIDASISIEEIDDSSIFCKIIVNEKK